MRRLKPFYCLFIIALLATMPFVSKAAEIMVPPGTDTLADAVAGAANGDTLILQDGAYFGDVLVNKSLTIRPQYRSTQAVVVDTMTIDGVGIEVTVQGLEFREDMILNEADAIRILENHWTANGINALNYTESQGVGSLVIVGNHLGLGSINSGVSTDNAYIAGNVLLDGRIAHNNGTAWIVGNSVRKQSSGVAIGSGSNAVSTRIIGNRLSCERTTICISLRSGSALIFNNIIEVGDAGGSPNRVIQLGLFSSDTGFAEIRNNIIRCKAHNHSFIRTFGYASFYEVRAHGNIITDNCENNHDHDAIVQFTHNLCSGDAICPNTDGNLNADPQFIDLTDYRLAPTSPAIDAGPPDFGLADLDRTRNDIGVYGGPWSIDQYDVQRDPQSLAPYVYPLFMGGIVSGGELELRAIGVARFR